MRAHDVSLHQRTRAMFASLHPEKGTSTTDPLEDYLESPALASIIDPLEYWNIRAQTDKDPALMQMALDFLSSPGEYYCLLLHALTESLTYEPFGGLTQPPHRLSPPPLIERCFGARDHPSWLMGAHPYILIGTAPCECGVTRNG